MYIYAALAKVGTAILTNICLLVPFIPTIVRFIPILFLNITKLLNTKIEECV